MTSCASGGAKRRCHDMAVIVTDVILTLARERASNGVVELHDLERIAALISGGAMVLDVAYARQEESCRKFHQLPKGNVGARSNPFHRLVVRPFEHLLSGEDPLSRAYLPNYFEFLGHALNKKMDGLEAHCRTIIQALMVVHGGNLTWDHFYADSRTVKTLHGALRMLRDYLGSGEGQKMWATCMMRPTPDLPHPSPAQINRIRQAVLETVRGLEAAE